MSAYPLLLFRMGLIAGLALLLILNFGITDAVRQRTGDVQWISNAPPPSTDTGNQFSRADSSLKRESRSNVVVSPMIMMMEVQQAAKFPSERRVRRLIGSSAPDCGHTCGACSPCNIQVVSYECSEALEPHAEACPLGYLCVCHGRSFPIP